MLLEISIAVGYVQSQLYTKLPRRRIDNFGDELTKLLTKKYQNHWFDDDPKKDSKYRSLNTNKNETSPVLIEAANSSNLDWSEISQCLPKGLIIELDPGNVTCQFMNANSNEQSLSHSPPTMNNVIWNNSSSGCSSASSETSTSNQNHVVLHTLYSSSNDTLTETNKTPASNPDVLESLKLETIFSDEGVSFPVLENWPLPTKPNNNNNNNLFSQRELSNCTIPSPALMRTSSQSMGTASAFIQYNKSASQPNGNSQASTAPPATSSRILALAANQNNSDLLLMKSNLDGTQKPSPPSAGPPNTATNPPFTAAMFAQTKFGSTKLKSNNKKNKRFVSPNDLSRVPQNSNNSSSENNPQSQYYNTGQKQETNNSKQEMLREALQFQQQLLKNAELRNNNSIIKHQQNSTFNTSTTTTVPAATLNPLRIPDLFNQKAVNENAQPSSLHNIWPTPIGAQRKPTQSQSSFLNSLRHEFDAMDNKPDKNNFLEDFSQHRIKSSSKPNTLWPSSQGSLMNSNPWANYSTSNEMLMDSANWSQSNAVNSTTTSSEIFSSPFLFNESMNQPGSEKNTCVNGNSDDTTIQQFTSLNLDSITL